MCCECKSSCDCAAHRLGILASKGSPVALAHRISTAENNMRFTCKLANALSAMTHAIAETVKGDVPCQQARGLAPSGAEGTHAKTAAAAGPETC